MRAAQNGMTVQAGMCGILFFCSAAAVACGVCVEDKMAATYDFTVVQKAAARRHIVVFCDVRGRLSQEALRSAAQKVPGVQSETVRTSAEPLALSFVIDPARQTPEAAVARVAATLGPPVEVELIRTVAPR